MSIIRTLTSATAIAGAILLVGCGEERPAPPPTANSSAPITTPDTDNSPKWVADPTDGGKVLGQVGIAEVRLGGAARQRDEALRNARVNLARDINTQVNDIMRDWTKEGGERFFAGDGKVDKQEMAKQMSETVSEQVTSQTINGSQQRAMWKDKSGTLYVWVVINADAAAKFAADATAAAKRLAEQKSFIKADIQATEAWDKLEQRMKAKIAHQEAAAAGK
jgi:hypothetical protein